ncbi:redoxin family protein [Gimesia aquarii]|uniref:Sporulation thiol-disulfide oxidoreductase A n=1 Tax=Gimesia aquarii TaxID=2527964 RepID=A0A517VQJ4_9PLAN|nr:redoxin family protein [Gimesia aquarii]QDT95296.1 Sporulation thiol-disulfide oxidoreductase A precursor [Gimesia aquarii]
MSCNCIAWKSTLNFSQSVQLLILLLSMLAANLWQTQLWATETQQNKTPHASNQLAQASDKKKPNTAKPEKHQIPSKRPPEIKILSTVKEGGGYGKELHRVTIKGIARTTAGDPVKDADIYVASYASRMPGNFERLRSRTKSDASGRFELKDIQLLVIRQRANPLPKPVEGGFIIFGTKDKYGFTWHPTRNYRPYKRPTGIDKGDKNEQITARAFYQSEPISVDLMFEPAVKLRGHITDDLGQPLAGAKVQFGLVDNLRDPGGWGLYSCLFLGNKSNSVLKPVAFDGILSLPAEFRETRTDPNGYYEFNHLRRDTSYLANIDPGPEYDPWQFRLETTNSAKKNKRIVRVGYDGKLDREFIAPRNVRVRVVQSKSDRPVPNVLITAEDSRKIRRGGIQARSDSQGNAMLKLLPGKYTLKAEPTPDQPFVFLSQKQTIPQTKDDVAVTLKLSPAAVVKLKVVDADTNKPISGVRFDYETDTSSRQIPVSTQTVYVDYPKTNTAGELQIFMEPGMRRFIVTEPQNLAYADSSRGKLVKLSGGQTAEILFRLSKPQFLPAEIKTDNLQPDKSSIYPEELQLKWHTQSERLKQTPLRIAARQIMLVKHNISAKNLLNDLRTLDPYQIPNINKILEKHHHQKLTWAKVVITSDRGKNRADHYYSKLLQKKNLADQKRIQQPDRISVFNGKKSMSYSNTNNQASVSVGHSMVYVNTVFDLCSWPSLRSVRPSKKSKIRPKLKISHSGKQTTYEISSKSSSFRRIFDQQTGFIFESSMGANLDEPERVNLYFAPEKYSNGLILPRVHMTWNMSQGKLRFLSAYVIEKVEILEPVPADAFAISLPTGTLLIDSRHVPTRSAGRSPVRPVTRTLRAPVTDMAAYLKRHPPINYDLESTIQYGKPAPKINPAKWLTAEGESTAPDLAGKVVLVEFWGTKCGPCLGQLPEVQLAAKHYAKHPFVLIGMHDSYATAKDLQAFAQKEKISYQLAIDQRATEKGWFGQTMREFGVRGIPKAAVIDKKGNVAFVGSFNEALRTVDQLLQQKK